MAAAATNPNNWEWCAESTKIWESVEDSSWQEFNTRWYGSQCAAPQGLHDSKSPFLDLGPRLSNLGNFPSKILVRECYSTMFDRVWEKAMSGGKIGSLITGQPGTGKTLFLFYFLVRLLQLRQVVLFTLDGTDLCLFYHGKVYTTALSSLHTIQISYRLPQPKPQTSNVFIWSLFETKQTQEPNWVLITDPCLPVQAAPPDSIRFKIWDKHFGPMRVGMPLWTRDELAKGLPYQNQYDSFLDALHKDPSQYEKDPLRLFPGARGLLDEFQGNADPVLPEDALDHLLGVVIDRFGYSARDVFDAIFNFSKIMTFHQAAVRLNYAHLDDIIFDLFLMQNSSSSRHEMLAISPVCHDPYTDDRWTVSFKSDWVARGIIQHIDGAERKSLCRRILRRFPQASAMAGYFLEPRRPSPSFAVGKTNIFL